VNRFRVSAFPVDDYDTTNARIEKGRMQEIGVRDGDTIRITGMRSSGAICRPVEDGFKIPNDSEVTYLSPNPTILPGIRVSNHIMRNIIHTSSGLIPVTVEKIRDGTLPASRVCLMSLNVNSRDGDFDKSRLDGLVVCRNNRLYFGAEEPKNNFGYMVSNVEPADYSQITRHTAIEFVPADTQAILSSQNRAVLDRLEDVIPIVYQEDKNSAAVTIPSLEVFETGIRFFIYIKGSLDQRRVDYDGHISIAVTLEDDLDSQYDLSIGGGGGSSSPDKFEYRHEIRGNPINPDAKHLTITLHEILIQERFMMGARTRNRPVSETRSEYSKIGRFPSVSIISGPWRVAFPVRR